MNVVELPYRLLPGKRILIFGSLVELLYSNRYFLTKYHRKYTDDLKVSKINEEFIFVVLSQISSSIRVSWRVD